MIALIVAVDNGLSKSLVLSTLLNPTIDFEIPDTLPVNVGDSKVAYLLINDTPFSYILCPTFKELFNETSPVTFNLLFSFASALTTKSTLIIALSKVAVPVKLGETRLAYRVDNSCPFS